MASPLSDADKRLALLTILGQSASSAISRMLWKYSHNSLNVGLGAFFYGSTAVLIAATYGIARKSWQDTAVLLAATTAPLVVLLFGWDLSRFLLSTSLLAFIAVLVMESRKPAPNVRWLLPMTCAVCALPLIQIPFVFAFVEVAYVNDRSPWAIRDWPIGTLAVAGVRFFNRNIGPYRVDQMGTQSPPGDVWYVEEDGWHGVWLRRAATDTFDAYMTLPEGHVALYTLTIERAGSTIIARRSEGGVRQWDYSGQYDGHIVHGTYKGGIWTARIRR